MRARNAPYPPGNQRHTPGNCGRAEGEEDVDLERIWSGQVLGNLLINGLTPERSCYALGNTLYAPENRWQFTGTKRRHPPANRGRAEDARIWSGQVQGESPNKWLNARKKLLCARKCAVSA